MNKSCCFFGHRLIMRDDLLLILVEKIEHLIIECNINVFLFGGYGEFDKLCKKAVDELKHKYTQIEKIFILAYYKHDSQKIEYLRKIYDDVIYPEIGDKPKKFAILYRNRKIIDMSDYCLFFVENSTGGAYQAMQYAKRKRKEFFNLTNIKS